MRICVYGASSSALDPIFYSEAEKMGRILASHGHGLVFGGGREGLMGASARGAHSLNGEIIGIAPRFFDMPGILYEHCTETIYTETMRERKHLLENLSEACIVLPGGIGTYEEFFEMLTLKQLGQSDRAIILVNTKGYFDPLMAMLRHTEEEDFMGESVFTLFSLVATPEEAMEALENYVPTSGSVSGKYAEMEEERLEDLREAEGK
ncbi:MAG: TIGR00730 family Rossman fold protein [Clostridia bacterium]|nr:TIGR00730 family Rossman fold protein [Clostridia bacterium]